MTDLDRAAIRLILTQLQKDRAALAEAVLNIAKRIDVLDAALNPIKGKNQDL